MLLPGSALQSTSAALVLRRRNRRRDGGSTRALHGRPVAPEARGGDGRGAHLPDDPQRCRLLAPLVVWQSSAGPGCLLAVLPRLSGTGDRMKEVVALAVSVVAVTVLSSRAEVEAASLLRHLYFVPVVAAALRFGVVGGGVTAVAVVLLQTPRVFAAIERGGLTRPAAEHV